MGNDALDNPNQATAQNAVAGLAALRARVAQLRKTSGNPLEENKENKNLEDLSRTPLASIQNSPQNKIVSSPQKDADLSASKPNRNTNLDLLKVKEIISEINDPKGITHQSWHKLKEHYYDAKEWNSFLIYIQQIIGNKSETRSKMLSLYELATRILSIRDNRNNDCFIDIWIRYAKFLSKDSEEEARGVFKYMKAQRIGENTPRVLEAWADLEFLVGNRVKASKLLEEVSTRFRTQYTQQNTKTGPEILPLSDRKLEYNLSTQIRVPSVDYRPTQNDHSANNLSLRKPPKIELGGSIQKKRSRQPLKNRSLLSGYPARRVSSNYEQSENISNTITNHPHSIDALPVFENICGSSPSHVSSLSRSTLDNNISVNHVSIKKDVEFSTQKTPISQRIDSISPSAVNFVTPESFNSIQVHPRNLIPNNGNSERKISENGFRSSTQNILSAIISEKDDKISSPRTSERDSDEDHSSYSNLSSPDISRSHNEKITHSPILNIPLCERRTEIQENLNLSMFQGNGSESDLINDYLRGQSNVFENSSIANEKTSEATHAAKYLATPKQLLSIQHEPKPSPSMFHQMGDSIVEICGKQYMRLEMVGQGGSSKVFKIMGPDRKIYALKRVRVSKKDTEAIINYSNEIKLLLKLKGKSNIVQLVDHEVLQASGLIHLVLEFGDIDLARLLSKGRGKPVNGNFLRLYWQQMLEAVHTIHEERIVHGDLKPANFLLVEGCLKLIDFGIAKAIQSDDTTNIVRDSQVGTPNYMSPEALLCDGTDDKNAQSYKLGRASDIWSLGCILYQMIYGKTPFAHLGMLQKLHCITDPKYEINYPSVKNRFVIDVLQGCLQRDPSKRLTIPELLRHPFLCPESLNPRRDQISQTQVSTVSRSTIQQILEQLSTMNVSVTDVKSLNDNELLEQLYKSLLQNK